MIILTTFYFGSISDGALWVPAYTALIVAFFFAKDKKNYMQIQLLMVWLAKML